MYKVIYTTNTKPNLKENYVRFFHAQLPSQK